MSSQQKVISGSRKDMSKLRDCFPIWAEQSREIEGKLEQKRELRRAKEE